MFARPIKHAGLLTVIAATASCTAGSAGTDVPYATSFTKAGDTTIAATTGDVPERLLRHFVVDWRASNDSIVQAIGDVSDMAIALDGRVWIWDRTTPALWLMDVDGKAMRKISRAGSGPGEYRNANSIAVARDGALVMWDNGNSRITIYNADGTYRSTAPLQFGDCCGMSVYIDTQNRIWLTTHPRMVGDKGKLDPNEAGMGKPEMIGYFRYDSAGKMLDTLMAPTMPGVDPLVTAMHISATGIGGMSQVVPYANHARHEVSPSGHIVSVVSRPYAVHTMFDGKPVRITREFTPPPVPDDERAQLRAAIEFRMVREKSDFKWNGPEIPREKPPINDLVVGLDGRIWVNLSVESEVYEPDPPRARGNEPPPPPVKYRAKEKRWDVFEPDGRYLGRVAAPRNYSVYVRRGNEAWGVVRDENDVPVVVHFRVEPRMQE